MTVGKPKRQKRRFSESTMKGRLANAILDQREFLKFRQEDLAAKSGVSRATIAEIEAAEANPRLETLLAIAEALDVSLERLIVRKRGQKAALSNAALRLLLALDRHVSVNDDRVLGRAGTVVDELIAASFIARNPVGRWRVTDAGSAHAKAFTRGGVK